MRRAAEPDSRSKNGRPGKVARFRQSMPTISQKARKMPRIKPRLAFFVVCLVMSACANQVQNKEDMLAAAGFTLVPANTPQRQAALTAMPAHKFVHRVPRQRGGLYLCRSDDLRLPVLRQSSCIRPLPRECVPAKPGQRAGDDRSDEPDGLGHLGARLVLLGDSHASDMGIV